MKRLLILVAFPLMLFGLERVNLIKNHGFEKEDSSWLTYSGTWFPAPENDSARANARDSTRAFDGSFSASDITSSQPGDPTPPGIIVDSAVVIQSFLGGKKMGDLDSLWWVMKVLPSKDGFDKVLLLKISLLFDMNLESWINGVYRYYGPTLTPSGDEPHIKVFNSALSDDTSWISCGRSLRKDWIETRGLSENTKLDSLGFVGFGKLDGAWYGQKAYWDDIRLTGYADYDVGVKGILSKDSVWKNTGYTPTARIKNFGRKPADSFLVIATIEGGAGVVYADTLSWSLTADTEDTLSFKEFKPSDAANYTLTVSTIMTPDESDEDDVMSKTLYGSGIEEQPIPEGLTFEVSSFALSPWVSYSIPAGQQGTISLYDPAGRRIEFLTVQGEGSVSFKSGLATGVYFIRLETSRITITRKAVVLR